MTASPSRDGRATTARVLRNGVAKREVAAWAMYDFANSGYTTVVLTTVFSAYFVGVVAQGASWATLAFTSALSASYLLIMVTMPGLGARADAKAGKRRLLFTSTMGCVVATALLARIGPGDVWWGMCILALSNYCYCVGETVVAAFLPELATAQGLGRVSGWGWGVGYFGGMLTLGLCLALVGWAEGQGLGAATYVPWTMLLTAAIFALAAIPSFVWLRERSSARAEARTGLLQRLAHAWSVTRLEYPDFFRLLLCGACYHAGISVVITLAAVYATQAMGFNMASTMMLVFAVNIAAAVGAFIFGHLQDRIGHQTALRSTLIGWLIMVVLAVFAIQPWIFWVAATVAGLCMGSSQSAGRAMVGALAPERRLAEFYALWGVAVRLAAVVGPFCYGLMVWATSGNHRLALLFTGLFFVAGLALLGKLDFDRGLRARAMMSQETAALSER